MKYTMNLLDLILTTEPQYPPQILLSHAVGSVSSFLKKTLYFIIDLYYNTSYEL